MAQTAGVIGLARTGGVSRRVALLAFARRKPLGAVGVGLVVGLVCLTALAPVLAPYNPLLVEVTQRWVSPSSSHPLGTDSMGRDILSRILYGGWVSLPIGISAALLGTTAGAVVGLLTGYVKGGTDILIQRLMDAIQAFPALIMALSVAYVLGPRVLTIIVAIAIPMVPIAARVVRSSVLSLREHQFVEAARAIGCGTPRLLALHIAPNCVAPFLVVLTAQVGWAIVVEASLGFLGMGVPPPTPTWGQMLSGSLMAIQTAWWEPFFPGLAISLVVFGFNLFGDALRDLLDPRLRGNP